MGARETALLTLDACEKQGAWSNAYLKKAIRRDGLDRRDAALASRLCFGVLQNKLLLDFYIGTFSTVKPEKLEPRVRQALRLGLYQLLFLDKIPERAAVNESVALAKKYSRNPRSAGLVNAVLRAFLRQRDTLPPVVGKDGIETLSLQTSHPRWLVEAFAARLGLEEAGALLRLNNEQPPTCAQVNLLKTTPGALAEALREEGAEVQPHPWLENCLLLSGTGDLEQLERFRAGDFYVQDAASRLAVLACGVKPGDRVLDACAAPGGKTFAAAIQMEDRGEVISCDIHPHKIQLLEAGAERLGLSCITVREQDAKSFVQEWEGAFDAVLADVPCSGLGIIRKKPDIRYKDPAPMEQLPAVQRAILDNAGRYVKPGGVLLYSTCTLLQRENEDVVTAFLEAHPEFVLAPFTLPGPVGACGGMLTLWPQRHGTDGFFVAGMRRAPRRGGGLC